MILTGGNVDPRILAQIIMRGLVHSGRLSRISVDITDVPGALARVSTIIGEYGGNIIEVAHQRTFNDLSIKAAVLELMVKRRRASPSRGASHRRARARGLPRDARRALVTDGC